LCAAKDAAGPILVTVLGMVAEMEPKFIRERQQAGIEAVRVSTRGVSRLCRSKRSRTCVPLGMVQQPSPRLLGSAA